MRTIVSLLLSTLAACAAPPQPPESTASSDLALRNDDPALSPLGFLCGAWVSDRGPDRTEEHWTQASAGTMLGVNRVIRSGRTGFFEFLRIEAADGGVFYHASPAGGAPTAFRMVERDGERVIFENPQHDFPQRISYWRTPDGRLHARAETLAGASGRVLDFTWIPARVARR